MKILITGICGFVGSTLATSMRHEQPVAGERWEIVGIDNLSRPGSEINRGPLAKLGVQLFHGDLRSREDVNQLPACDCVIDAAAITSVLAGVDGQSSSRQVLDHNLSSTIHLLEYCRSHRAGFILLSTSRVYSIKGLSALPMKIDGDQFRLDESQELPRGVSRAGVDETFSTSPPISLYGVSKLASELLALEFGETFNFPVWINRCGVLAGAGQFGRADQGIFTFWINAYLRRKPLKYIGFGGRGLQIRDAFHPRDLVPLLTKQIGFTGAIPSRTINLGGGVANAMSLAQLSKWCENRFGRAEIASDQSDRPFDIPWMVMDSRLASERWDWQPRIAIGQILEEIADHAERHEDWLLISGSP